MLLPSFAGQDYIIDATHSTAYMPALSICTDIEKKAHSSLASKSICLNISFHTRGGHMLLRHRDCVITSS